MQENGYSLYSYIQHSAPKYYVSQQNPLNLMQGISSALLDFTILDSVTCCHMMWWDDILFSIIVLKYGI